MSTREAVVLAALGWVGTPFHDCARVKGAGVDCANLLAAVYTEAGLVDVPEFGAYSPQWFQHRDEPLFLSGLAKYAHQVERPQMGDIAMYSFGRHAAHGAIWVDERTIIHAYKPAGAVVKGDPQPLTPRLDSYWSLYP